MDLPAGSLGPWLISWASVSIFCSGTVGTETCPNLDVFRVPGDTLLLRRVKPISYSMYSMYFNWDQLGVEFLRDWGNHELRPGHSSYQTGKHGGASRIRGRLNLSNERVKQKHTGSSSVKKRGDKSLHDMAQNYESNSPTVKLWNKNWWLLGGAHWYHWYHVPSLSRSKA